LFLLYLLNKFVLIATYSHSRVCSGAIREIPRAIKGTRRADQSGLVGNVLRYEPQSTYDRDVNRDEGEGDSSNRDDDVVVT
jgi:hypothetical protein